MKIPKQLAGMVNVKVCTSFLAFEQDDGFSIAKNRLVNLFSLFGANVRNEFRGYFHWVKNVVTEDLDKWHDHGVFSSLFCRDPVFCICNAC